MASEHHLNLRICLNRTGDEILSQITPRRLGLVHHAQVLFPARPKPVGPPQSNHHWIGPGKPQGQPSKLHRRIKGLHTGKVPDHHRGKPRRCHHGLQQLGHGLGTIIVAGVSLQGRVSGQVSNTWRIVLPGTGAGAADTGAARFAKRGRLKLHIRQGRKDQQVHIG